MRRPLAWACAPVALLMAGVAAAAPAVGDYVSFVACPVARDTGPQADLCFFAEHDGEVYALTNPADWGNPQLKHRVLVEGRLTDAPAACGGRRIDGRVSVLAEIDNSCDRIVPFDGVIVGGAGGIFNSGTPEQRARAQDLARRAELDPSLSVQPANPEAPPPAVPAPPFERKAFTVYYPFDSDRGSGPDMAEIQRLTAYAVASKGTVQLVSRQGASRLTGGEVLAERPGMARRRAEKLAGIMVGLGAPAASVRTEAVEAPAAPDGVEDWRERRIEVTVTPKP